MAFKPNMKKPGAIVAASWMRPDDESSPPSPEKLHVFEQQNPGARFLPDDREDLNVPGFAERGEMAEAPEHGETPQHRQAEVKHDVQFTRQHQDMMQHGNYPQPQRKMQQRPQFKKRPFAEPPKFGK